MTSFKYDVSVIEECKQLFTDGIKFVDTDEDDEGLYYMFSGKGMWFDVREANGQYTLIDFGFCSDWSSVE